MNAGTTTPLSTPNARQPSPGSFQQWIHDLEVPKALTVIEIFRVELVAAGMEGSFYNEGGP